MRWCNWPYCKKPSNKPSNKACNKACSRPSHQPSQCRGLSYYKKQSYLGMIYGG